MRTVPCAVLAALLLFTTSCLAQVALPGQSTTPFASELNKYPGLMPELGRLFEKLQHDIKYPPDRFQSRLMPFLPESTLLYGALPNYGEVAHQLLETFHQELQRSAVLRDWWLHSDIATTKPNLEDSLEWFYEVSEYLGDEIVISGGTDGREPKLLILSEIRRPGLKKLLKNIVTEAGGEKKLRLRVLEPQELATAREGRTPGELFVLIRADYVAAASHLGTLRTFNSSLHQRDRTFVSSPFGERVEQAYVGGTTMLAGADLHSLMNLAPSSTLRDQANFRRTGLCDVKYLVWQHKNAGSHTVSQWELSFTGPRHGVAGWLARPRTLGSLDFVSANALAVLTLVVNDPPQIFEDIKKLSTNGFASLTQMERALNLSLKKDLLRYLDGEVTIELDDIPPGAPVWRALLRVTDSTRLQQTLATLLAVALVNVRHVVRDGITYYTLRIPSAKTPTEIAYAFVDGYLIIASSADALTEAIALHGTVDSLDKSEKFRAALPPGHPEGASVLLYENPIAMMRRQFQQLSPGMMASLLPAQSAPVIFSAYGYDTAIRGASTNAAFDAGVVLAGAAIAIPNVMRSKIAANEASALDTIRTVNNAQITYASTYPQRGFAPDLATLGPDPRRPSAESVEHAGLLDASLAGGSCTAGAWCEKSGFRFNLTAACKQKLCEQFVVLGTPISSSTGSRNFCSAGDGIIRFKTGPPLAAMPSIAECQSWMPVQ